MSYCPDREVELILWCRWGVAVYKREHFFKDWTYDPATDEYSDWLDWTWWTPWACAWAKDPEVVCMSNDSWETVIKWVAIFNYDGTAWTTELQFIWGWVATWYSVVECSTSQVIEWEWRCDGWVTIVPFYETETDGAPSANVVFWFNPVTNSVVTPSWTQTLWVCWTADPLVISSEWISIWNTINPPATAVYAVISITAWDWVVTVDWTAPIYSSVWHPVFEWQKVYLQIKDEIDKFQSAWTWTMYVTYYDKPLLLSQQ